MADADQPGKIHPDAISYLTVEQIKTVQDIDRLDPHQFALFAATPATALDIFRIQTDLRDVISKMRDDIERELRAMMEKIEGPTPRLTRVPSGERTLKCVAHQAFNCPICFGKDHG